MILNFRHCKFCDILIYVLKEIIIFRVEYLFNICQDSILFVRRIHEIFGYPLLGIFRVLGEPWLLAENIV